MFLRKIICESVIHQSNIVWTSLSALFQSGSWGRTGLFSFVALEMLFFKSFPTNQIRPSVEVKAVIWLLSDHFMWTHSHFLRNLFIFLGFHREICRKSVLYVLLKCLVSMLKLWSQIKKKKLKTPDSEALWNVGKI